ncbi:MAG: DUF2312 domain-containing protein [Candidatus Dormibacteria bacterium]
MTDETIIEEAPAPGLGHNGQLISLVERIERLNEEREGLGEDIKEVFGEAKSAGYNTAIIRKAIAIRRMDPAKRAEIEALLDTYLRALGTV